MRPAIAERPQRYVIAVSCPLSGLILLLTVGSLAVNAPHALSSPEETRALPTQESPAVQILRASDWKGGAWVGAEDCTVASGEFTYWVYATATQCGVPREQAERVVLLRQPTIAIAPLTAKAQLAGGRYAVWVYGAGQPGHPWVHLCGSGRICVKGELSPTPAWAFLGWIEIRDNQLLYLRTWDQPINHSLHVQVLVLSSSETRPDWVP